MWMIVGLITLCIASCTSCENKSNTIVVTPVKGNLVVDNLVSTDRQDMFMNYSKDYRWYETSVVLEDFLDEDCDGTVAEVSNIFQVVSEKDSVSADVHVIIYTHTPESNDVQMVHSFWVGDFPLENEAITVNFKQAFDKVMEVNYPKPHSKHVVLRKEIGPKSCNPQYIFGNTRAQLYVDAITGEVRDTNPAFEGFVGMPLGEWP